MLEQKIERLTEVMERVVALLEGGSPAFPKSDIEAACENLEANAIAEIEQQKATEEKPKGVTHQDLQDMCMTLVREDRSRKVSIKDALADVGATVITDVPNNKLEELKTALEAIK